MHLFYLIALFAVFTISTIHPQETKHTPCWQVAFDPPPPLDASPETKRAYDQFLKMNYELGKFGSHASEFILNISFLQDTLIAYLHNAESRDEYLRGMHLFQEHASDRLKSVSSYITSIFNFYTAEAEPPHPQEVTISYNGQNIRGFLNTFKQRRKLTAEERQELFTQEYTHYLKDATTFPFTLDETTIEELLPETVYNFALLADGQVRASLERVGDREYHVGGEMTVEAFRYPNHTILASSAQAVVVTAGAMILHQVEDKKLYFISSKSGHFQPSYLSLEFMKSRLKELNVPEDTIVAVPDLNMATSIIKTYKGAQVPLLLTQQDAAELFQIAKNRFDSYYHEIDRPLLEALAKGTMTSVDADLALRLKSLRAEATYMRSSYSLFSKEHEPPQVFAEFVKRFGKLKDALKSHKFNPDKIHTEAQAVLILLSLWDMNSTTFTPSDDKSLVNTISKLFSDMQHLLSQESLDKEEYHSLKKLARTTGALFMYMAHYAKDKGRGYGVFSAAKDGFFQINDLMAQTDYVRYEHDRSRVVVPRKIANLFAKYISHIGIGPYHFHFTLDPKETWWIINNAKEAYFSSHLVLNLFRDIAEGNIQCHEIDQELALNLLAKLKRDLERARNMLIYLDSSHQAPESYDKLHTAATKMIEAILSCDYTYIKQHAQEFADACYHEPPKGLENWKCTDQESFNKTLKKSLQPLALVIDNAALSRSQAKEIADACQALQDFATLSRQNGLFTGESHDLPMVVFDRLEKVSGDLFHALDAALASQDQEIRVTQEMALAANFIYARAIQP